MAKVLPTAMSIIDTVERWFAPPVVERTAYRCADCGKRADAEDALCADCDGEVRAVDEPVACAYWGPHH